MIIIVTILVIIAAVSKAVMDTIQHHYYSSVFNTKKLEKWANPNLSWRNKWKNPDSTENELKEKFIGSSTVFVFTTDLWHLAQFVFLNCIFIIIVLFASFISIPVTFIILLNPIIDFVILRIIFGVTFELFYSKLFRK